MTSPQPNRQTWYGLVAICTSVLLIAAVLLWTSARVTQVSKRADETAHRVARESEQKWCALIVALDDAYSSTPPQSELGRQVAQAIDQLRTDFGCPDGR